MELLDNNRSRLVLLLGVCLFYTTVAEIRITRFSIVPSNVQIGITKEVTLDCVYQYDPPDYKLLAVKFFRNGQKEMVLQWIPNTRPPYTRGVFRGMFVDPGEGQETVISVDNSTVEGVRENHVKVVINQISHQIEGNYTCEVGSDSSVFYQRQTEQLILYKPAIDDQLLLVHNETEKRITCQSQGVFPEPEVRLLVEDGEERVFLEDEDPVVEEMLDAQHNVTGYQVYMELSYNETALPSRPFSIKCNLTVPGTDYVLQSNISFPKENSCGGLSGSLQLIVLVALAIPCFSLAHLAS